MVSVPATGEFALAFMCGEHTALQCTPEQFYEFLGDNTLSPFKIEYVLHPTNETDVTDYTPPEMPTYPCWVAPDVST